MVESESVSRILLNTHEYNLVFCTRDGRQLSYDNVKRDFLPILRATKVGKTEGSFHVLAKANFWHLPVRDERNGLDGSTAIIEGVKDGKYQVVNRWSPKRGHTWRRRSTCLS
jgi:hypothetical protein